MIITNILKIEVKYKFKRQFYFENAYIYIYMSNTVYVFHIDNIHIFNNKVFND